MSVAIGPKVALNVGGETRIEFAECAVLIAQKNGRLV